MRVRKLHEYILCATVCVAAGAAMAQEAETSPIEGVDPQIVALASALGAHRGIGEEETVTAIRFVEYHLQGRSEGAPAAAVLTTSYPEGAIRIQIGPDTEAANVHVAKGDRAWDEDTPGVNPVDVTDGVSDRAALIWLTPHGAAHAIAEADAVEVSQTEGMTVMNADIPAGQISVTLDADLRPTKVELTVEGATQSATYGDYSDVQGYGVFSPGAMTVVGNPILGGDFTVTSFMANPYVAFPEPELLASNGQ